MSATRQSLEVAGSGPLRHWYMTPSDFLGNLSEADRGALLGCGKWQHYARNEHVFKGGSPGRNVYLLAEGRAKIYKLAASGREVILWFCLPGELFGLAEFCRGGPREVFAQLCTDAKVCCISREAFAEFLRDRPDSALQIVDLLSCRLRVLGDILLNLASDDAGSRVMKLLLRLAARYGQAQGGTVCLDLPLTHQEMADMVGATRQTVTQTLGRLRRSGALRLEQHRFYLDCRLLSQERGYREI